MNDKVDETGRDKTLSTVYFSVALILNLLLFLGSQTRSPCCADPALCRILPWAIGSNLLSGALAAWYLWGRRWRRPFSKIAIVDLSLPTSILLFLVFGCTIFEGKPKEGLLGFVYVLYVFSKGFVLVWYALVDVNGRSGRFSFSLWVLMVTFLVYAAITPWVAFKAWPDADEPHYLLLTHSLVKDHDFNMANNYQQGDYRSFYPPELPDHHTLIDSGGREYPIHDVGISLLLVPGYLLANRLGAMLELNVVAALLALGFYQLAREIGATSRGALVAWALFAFVSPLVVYSSQIYPEVVGGACAVWIIYLFAKFVKMSRLFYLLFAALLMSVLPWFSVRYWMILWPLFTIFALFLLVRPREGWTIQVLKGLSTLFLPLALSMSLFALFDLRHYNVPIPNAGYFLYMTGRQIRGLSAHPTFTGTVKALMRSIVPQTRSLPSQPPMFTHKLQVGLLGLLFDRAYGLFPTAPIYVIAFAGVRNLLRRQPWVGGAILATVGTCFLFAGLNLFWYGGWAPPSRYIFPAVALMGPLASLLIPMRKFRWMIRAFSGWSFGVAAAYTAFPLTRYTFWDVNTGALSRFVHQHIGVDYGVVFPSFIRAGFIDYLMAALWAGGAGVCIWLLNRNGSREAIR